VEGMSQEQEKGPPRTSKESAKAVFSTVKTT
jgi:hypothetical protein